MQLESKQTYLLSSFFKVTVWLPPNGGHQKTPKRPLMGPNGNESPEVSWLQRDIEILWRGSIFFWEISESWKKKDDEDLAVHIESYLKLQKKISESNSGFSHNWGPPWWCYFASACGSTWLTLLVHHARACYMALRSCGFQPSNTQCT